MQGLHYLHNTRNIPHNSRLSQNEHLLYSISLIISLAAGQPQPFVSAIPPLFRRGETPLYIPSIPDVDRYPSSEIHLPRKPSDKAGWANPIACLANPTADWANPKASWANPTASYKYCNKLSVDSKSFMGSL